MISTKLRSLLTVLALFAAASANAQSGKRIVEQSDFDVKLGFIHVGSGQWTVLAYDTVDNHQTFHAMLTINGGFGPAKVDDHFESWGDATSWRVSRDVFSRRFVENHHELRYQKNVRFEISPERGEWTRNDGLTQRIPAEKPLDELTMLVFIRSLPLRVGDTYTIPRYFKADGNPVVLRVLRRETVTVPAGTFQTVVVQPIIKTSGLFGDGGEAEVYLTDDRFHSLVQLKSKVARIGSLTLQLKRYHPPSVTDDPRGSESAEMPAFGFDPVAEASPLPAKRPLQ